MAATSVQVPPSITIPPGQTSVNADITVNGGDTTAISILGVFTISIKSKTTTSPQLVTLTLSLKPGTARPGNQSQPISVTVNGQTVNSPTIPISY